MEVKNKTINVVALNKKKILNVNVIKKKNIAIKKTFLTVVVRMITTLKNKILVVAAIVAITDITKTALVGINKKMGKSPSFCRINKSFAYNTVDVLHI